MEVRDDPAVHPTIAIGLAGLLIVSAIVIWRLASHLASVPEGGASQVRWDRELEAHGGRTIATFILGELRLHGSNREVWLRAVDRVRGDPGRPDSTWRGTAYLLRPFPPPFPPPPVRVLEVLRPGRVRLDQQEHDVAEVLIEEWADHARWPDLGLRSYLPANGQEPAGAENVKTEMRLALQGQRRPLR